METHVFEIATGAGIDLMNPLAVSIAVVIVLALATGIAGRVALLVEDLWHRADGGPADDRLPVVHE